MLCEGVCGGRIVALRRRQRAGALLLLLLLLRWAVWRARRRALSFARCAGASWGGADKRVTRRGAISRSRMH